MTEAATLAERAVHPPPAGLTWGLRRSFIRYVSLLADGNHAVTGGASLTHSSLFNFKETEESAYDPMGKRGVLKFKGELRISGHQGLLFVMIVDPWIELVGARSLLTAVDTRHWPERSHRLPIATLDAGNLVMAHDRIQGPMRAFLSTEGREIFDGQYAPGEELDPVFILAHPKTAE